MSIVIDKTMQALQAVVKSVPVGTNLALLQLLWMMLQGSLLRSRGAIFPALIASGFGIRTARRCWAAMRYGVWQTETILADWQEYVEEQGQWQEHQQGGYCGVAVDLTGFWRPRLKGWLGKHFHNLAGKALPAVVFGVVVRVGQIGSQRVPLLKALIRAEEQGGSDGELNSKVLAQVGRELKPEEVALFDAGFKLAALQKAQIKQGVVRLACNVTAYRNEVAPYKGRGRRPIYGEIVRPLARHHKDKTIPATNPDFSQSFAYQGRSIAVIGWHNLILPGLLPDPDNETFDVYVFDDPLYEKPLLLASTFRLPPRVGFTLYLDRWAVEQVPLASKHMIGAHRQFVSATLSCQRLPELAMIAGNVLTYLAAVLPPIPSGFWDSRPKSTPGRLRRLLARADFPKDYPFWPQLRKKQSVTAQLPKGIAAHQSILSP